MERAEGKGSEGAGEGRGEGGVGRLVQEDPTNEGRGYPLDRKPASCPYSCSDPKRSNGTLLPTEIQYNHSVLVGTVYNCGSGQYCNQYKCAYRVVESEKAVTTLLRHMLYWDRLCVTQDSLRFKAGGVQTHFTFYYTVLGSATTTMEIA
eukprot:2096294-Rhodomonas_salina.1